MINIIPPKYSNTNDSVIDDTRLFLQQVTGSYIEVDIKNNEVTKCEIYNNLDMIAKNSLSDNARCYTSYSVPTLSREHGLKTLFEDLCSYRCMPDTIIFIALGDFPVVMKDQSKHPHCDRYIGKYEGIYPAKMAKVFSRSIIPSLHDDVMIPTRDFIDVVYGFSNLARDINHDFKTKKPIAVFRGSWTGNDRTIKNTRIQAKILSKKYHTYLDADITKTFEYYMYEQDVGFVHTSLTNTNLYDPSSKSNMTLTEQGKQYKYILHIDGFVSAWRLAAEMLSMSTILKVDSEWVEHYYHDLKPWVHYIPIKADLSNLIQMICWCREHDDECFRIANNAYIYAVLNFTKMKLFNYMEEVVYDKKIPVFTKPYKYKSVVPPITLPRIPKKEFCFQSKTKYIKDLLPMKRVNNVPYLNALDIDIKYLTFDLHYFPDAPDWPDSLLDIYKNSKSGQYKQMTILCSCDITFWILRHHNRWLRNILYYPNFSFEYFKFLIECTPRSVIIVIHFDDLMTYQVGDEIIKTCSGKVIIFNNNINPIVDTSESASKAKIAAFTATIENDIHTTHIIKKI